MPPATSTADLQTQLIAYQAAASDILANGQAYQIAGRTLTRANLREVQDQIKYLTEQINAQSRTDGGMRVRTIIPF